MQIGQLNQNLDAINNQSSQIINQALGTLMSDAACFTTFAGYGRYSGAVSFLAHFPDSNTDSLVPNINTGRHRRHCFCSQNLLDFSINERKWVVCMGRGKC